MACRAVLKAEEIAAECRRLGTGESGLIDAINAAVHVGAGEVVS
jgi:hypothetical protein